MIVEQEQQQEIAREVRASLAFEHMLAAAMIGGGASASGALVLQLVRLAAETSLTLMTSLEALLRALTAGVVVFLLAFAASVAVFTPLYMVLEKNRVRTIWPFHLAALAVQLGVLAMLGLAPGFEAPWRVIYLLPGLLIVSLFGRRIAPLWRAADRAAPEVPGIRRVQ
ncbi:MAG: hypothetical protein HXY23_06930 [Parvularculaceae bacterium]|nr:hypothetical protein [Parvularculaceae bacterium]